MPSWLQKLGKHERDRSDSATGRSPSPSSSSTGRRSRATSSSFSHNSHANPSVHVIPPVPVPGEMGENKTDNTNSSNALDTNRDESPGPSFTIVPPSPATLDNASLASESSPENTSTVSRDGKKRQNIPPNVSIGGEPTTSEDTPTPRPTVSVKPTLPTLLSSSHLRREASESSIRSGSGMEPLHIRAATTPANPVLQEPEGEGFLVDSPEADSPPAHEQIPSDNTITPTPSPNTADRQSQNTKNRRKPSWGKSNKKKPTGLAAAIASTSFAMVNPHGGNMTLPQSLPNSSTQKDEERPPMPPAPPGITTGASSAAQAKRASLSAGALPLPRHQNPKKSPDAPAAHKRRSATHSNPPTHKRGNRRAVSEYTPGGENVPPVPSAKGASKSSPGLNGSAITKGLSSASMLGLGLAGRGAEEMPTVASPVGSPSLSSPQSNGNTGYFSGPEAAGASSVEGWTSSDDDKQFDDSESEDETSSEESDDVNKELAGLDLGDDRELPTITGFAVASSRRNQEFHDLFPTIPEGDYLIDDYGCALQREILIQGRLYVSENHVCFHANIFGWITDLSIPVFEIISLEKKMTAFVIPNAIQITTRRAKYTFASFLARDTTFDVIFNVWRSAKAGSNPDSEIPTAEIVVDASAAEGVQMPNGGSSASAVRKATRCACGIKGEHYAETAMEIVIPGTPERLYNLMFASGFLKDFLRGDQKLLDLQMSDWAPVAPGSNLLTRNLSYVKPLNGSIGPKQTKCEITDEVVHCDFNDYISTITTTKTPDVPSGGVFSVKTRTCIMWASAVSTRVIVTTQVEWTGRSFVKGIIERSCIDGQKTYHADLDRCMRAYIQEHQSEFIPEGIDPALASAEAAAEATTVSKPEEGIPPSDKQREHERNERAMQWAYDTFAGAARVAKESTKGAVELVSDAWDQSSSTTILWFVIVLLVISNLATFFGGSRSMRDARHAAGQAVLPPVHTPRDNTQDWVKDVVREIWDEMRTINAVPTDPVAHYPHSTQAPSPIELKLELQALSSTLNDVERKLKELRVALGSLEDSYSEIGGATAN